MSKKTDYWIGWSGNYIRSEGGFILHAFDPNKAPSRSLCGVKIEDTGNLSVDEQNHPGCIRCRNSLRRLKILPSLDK